MGGNAPLEWLPAREAVNRISAACGGDLIAKAAIVDRLRDRMLRAHADKAVLTTTAHSPSGVSGVSLQAAALARRKPIERTDCEIACDAWGRSDGWEADQENWRWATGDFSISWLGVQENGVGYSQNVFRHFQFYGVKFLASEIDRIAPSRLPVADAAPGESSQARRVALLPPVTDAEVEQWIGEMAAARVRIRDVSAELVKSKWAGHSRLPKRDEVREALRTKLQRLGVEVKEGRPVKRAV